jgi:hypothetical protein
MKEPRDHSCHEPDEDRPDNAHHVLHLVIGQRDRLNIASAYETASKRHIPPPALEPI